MSVTDGWQRSALRDKGSRWDPAELGPGDRGSSPRRRHRSPVYGARCISPRINAGGRCGARLHRGAGQSRCVGGPSRRRVSSRRERPPHRIERTRDHPRSRPSRKYRVIKRVEIAEIVERDRAVHADFRVVVALGLAARVNDSISTPTARSPDYRTRRTLRCQRIGAVSGTGQRLGHRVATFSPGRARRR